MRQLVFVLSSLSAIGGVFAQSPAVGGDVFTTPVPAPGPGKRVMLFNEISGAATKDQGFAFISSEFSFDGAVVKNAPYSADAVTETTQRLADGNRITRKTTAAVYRDSEGRTRREETLGSIGPWATNSEPLQTVFINDPVSKTNLVLDIRNKSARKMPTPEIMPFPAGEAGAAFGVTGSMVQTDALRNRVAIRSVYTREVQPMVSAAPVTFNTAGTAMSSDNVKTESLPSQVIEGVRADGTRTTVTIPAGAVGNERPIEIVSERWYSSELQTVVKSTHSDPRMEETVYRLINISRNEPSQSLFVAPTDYTVTENEDFTKRIDEQKMKMLLDREIQVRSKE